MLVHDARGKEEEPVQKERTLSLLKYHREESGGCRKRNMSTTKGPTKFRSGGVQESVQKRAQW